MVLSDEQVKQFQRYLIYNHAAGIGEPAPVEHVRAAMLSRVAVHTRGHSGCRPEITQTYVAMLNARRDPDRLREGLGRRLRRPLADEPDRPLADGRGRVLLRGRAHGHDRDAMAKAGIPVPGLMARDGLAAINGSNLITGIACLAAVRRRALDSRRPRSPRR